MNLTAKETSVKRELRYIEKYTGTNHKGPAWIAYVKLSKSGKTVYFNGKALKRSERGVYRDIETSEDYWVSGIKKRGSNRHWAGSGKIMVASDAQEELKRLKDVDELGSSVYEIVSIKDTSAEDIIRLSEIENESPVQVTTILKVMKTIIPLIFLLATITPAKNDSLLQTRSDEMEWRSDWRYRYCMMDSDDMTRTG